MEIKDIYNYFIQCNKVETDTRKDLKNSMYFALKGDNFNGNIFAEKALKKGAKFAVVDEKKYQTDNNIFLVDDVLSTLQELATYHRKELGIPIVALTGSNGKTTTKELINAVLSKHYKCVATKGNLNNHIGVPLTLLSIKPETEIAVIEMGANHPQEIDTLCKITLPNYGFITNFGKVHLEGFGSFEGVIKAKTEMYRHLEEYNQTVFVNTNDSIQVENSKGLKRITFGGEKSNFPITFLQADPYVSLQFENTQINSRLIGNYNYSNIATAVAVGKYFKVPILKIRDAIENYIPSNNRSQIIQKGSNKIILDAYNANPNSMEVAIENLAQLSDNRKIAILGDMFEIGKDTLKEHQIIADLAQSKEFDDIILIGNTFSKLEINNYLVKQYGDFEKFKKEYDFKKIRNCTILIKASRGMALERVLDLL
ncbi:MAG: UDP-N-acetylmuramoyl-tripeptide--D-alanyl-D-alanine ligase [Bacteroidota bacterium]